MPWWSVVGCRDRVQRQGTICPRIPPIRPAWTASRTHRDLISSPYPESGRALPRHDRRAPVFRRYEHDTCHRTSRGIIHAACNTSRADGHER